MVNGTTKNGSSNDVSEHDLAWDSLSPAAIEKLAQPLDPGLVSQRKGRAGRSYDYLEGHVVIDQANRIFGFGGWGYELVGDVTLREIENVDTKTGEVKRAHVYSAPVQVTVPGAPARADIGFNAVAEDNADGHETAIKGAVTDGMKRALRSLRGPVRERALRRRRGRRPGPGAAEGAGGSGRVAGVRGAEGAGRRQEQDREGPGRTLCFRADADGGGGGGQAPPAGLGSGGQAGADRRHSGPVPTGGRDREAGSRLNGAGIASRNGAVSRETAPLSSQGRRQEMNAVMQSPVVDRVEERLALLWFQMEEAGRAGFQEEIEAVTFQFPPEDERAERRLVERAHGLFERVRAECGEEFRRWTKRELVRCPHCGSKG